ncbi:hypothetical protein HOLleu_23977 [Holothuria leucospilota]|uniref:Uncharacterized protein n=1 Tax=Holothuria leucospilota TaxID=206669 RepID=A0A9Q1H552_HOLLE|nr:hypothetical protein HOLleu_23977 [Holothuria leucospilota]
MSMRGCLLLSILSGLVSYRCHCKGDHGPAPHMPTPTDDDMILGDGSGDSSGDGPGDGEDEGSTEVHKERDTRQGENSHDDDDDDEDSDNDGTPSLSKVIFSTGIVAVVILIIVISIIILSSYIRKQREMVDTP